MKNLFRLISIIVSLSVLVTVNFKNASAQVAPRSYRALLFLCRIVTHSNNDCAKIDKDKTAPSRAITFNCGNPEGGSGEEANGSSAEPSNLLSLRIPNTFTFNDVSNPVFKVKGKGVRSFHLEILDKQGNLLFETSDITAGWNGIYQGKKVSAGVLTYKISVEGLSGEKAYKTGKLTLVYDGNGTM